MGDDRSEIFQHHGIAVRYEPAGAQTEVGGDFYELIVLDGHLLVAIGDVAGHSLRPSRTCSPHRRSTVIDGARRRVVGPAPRCGRAARPR